MHVAEETDEDKLRIHSHRGRAQLGRETHWKPESVAERGKPPRETPCSTVTEGAGHLVMPPRPTATFNALPSLADRQGCDVLGKAADGDAATEPRRCKSGRLLYEAGARTVKRKRVLALPSVEG